MGPVALKCVCVFESGLSTPIRVSLIVASDNYRSFGHMSKEAPQFHYSKRRSHIQLKIMSRLRIFLVLSVIRLRRTLRLV